MYYTLVRENYKKEYPYLTITWIYVRYYVIRNLSYNMNWSFDYMLRRLVACKVFFFYKTSIYLLTKK